MNDLMMDRDRARVELGKQNKDSSFVFILTIDGGIGASPELSASALSSLLVLAVTLFCSRR